MSSKYAGAVWKCLSIYDTFGEDSYKDDTILTD